MVEGDPEDEPQAPEAHRLPKGLFEATPGEQLAFQGHFQFRQLSLELLEFRLGFPVFVTAQMFPDLGVPWLQFSPGLLSGLHLVIPGFQRHQVVFQLGEGLFPVRR